MKYVYKGRMIKLHLKTGITRINNNDIIDIPEKEMENIIIKKQFTEVQKPILKKTKVKKSGGKK